MKLSTAHRFARTFLPVVPAGCLFVACVGASAQTDVQKATVTIVGDADRFNIGQTGYCGKRTEIPNPSGLVFEVPAGKATVFYIRSKFRTESFTYTCEGDYAFLPEAKLLHIIRYTFEGDKCRLEMFRSAPSSTPVPMAFTAEARKGCLAE